MRCLLYFFIFLTLPSIFGFTSTNILSDYLYADYKKKEFHFTGHTRLTSQEMALSSDQLFYKSQFLSAKGHIEITQKKSQIFVKAEQLERNGSIMKIFTPGGRVSSKDLKNDRTIDSESIVVDQSGRKWEKIHFQGTPNLIGKDFKATSQKEILYDGVENSIIFTGTSRFEDQKESNKIQSQDIKYLESTQKLLFSSSVNITDDQNRFLSADRGVYNFGNKFLDLNGHVEYIGSVAVIHSEKLNTDSVFVKNSTQKKLVYYFEENVHLDYQSFKGTSKKIMVDPKDGYIELVGDVNLQGKSNGLKIRSDVMAISEKEKRSRFYDHVYFDNNNQHFRSDIAVYDDKTGVFTLMGNAHYEDGASQYDAQRIYLDNRTLSVNFVGMVSGLSSLKNFKGIQVESSPPATEENQEGTTNARTPKS